MKSWNVGTDEQWERLTRPEDAPPRTAAAVPGSERQGRRLHWQPPGRGELILWLSYCKQRIPSKSSIQLAHSLGRPWSDHESLGSESVTLQALWQAVPALRNAAAGGSGQRRASRAALAPREPAVRAAPDWQTQQNQRVFFLNPEQEGVWLKTSFKVYTRLPGQQITVRVTLFLCSFNMGTSAEWLMPTVDRPFTATIMSPHFNLPS